MLTYNIIEKRKIKEIKKYKVSLSSLLYNYDEGDNDTILFRAVSYDKIE
jgi:hypothetical protein